MNTFNMFLSENKVSAALALLNVDTEYTDDSLKMAYKRAASKAHPDKFGGSDSMMRDVRSAYELLSNTTMAKKQKETDDTVYADLADIVINTVDVQLNVKQYTDYFTKHIKKEFTHERDVVRKINRYTSWVNITHTWETQDKKTKLILQLTVHLGEAKYASGLSNSKSAIFDTQVSPTTYIDGNKKVLKNKWMRTNDAGFFDKPEKIFTKASITSKKGKFGKKDMLFGLSNRVGAEERGDLFHIPLGDGTHFVAVYRTTMMRMAQWNVHGIYINDGKRKVSLKISTAGMGLLLETEELLEAFVQVTKTRTIDAALKLIKDEAYKGD